MATRLICSKCNREKPETDFYKMKTGNRCDMCKNCLTMHIKNDDPQTFLGILEKFNIPYIEKKGVDLCNKAYQKNPGKFGPMSVLGTYIRTMNMTQYSPYTYADTEKLNEEDRRLKEEADARIKELTTDADTLTYVDELQTKLAAGEITQAEFNTLNPLLDIDKHDNIIPEFIKPVEINEEDIFAKLTEEDRTYLATKGGIMYKPSQGVRLEDMYKQYENEYSLNADRRETLIKMCKTSLKMDECLDIGDLTGYKNLSAAGDQLRKSGKFTESQKTQETVQSLSTVGELAKFCEKSGPIYQFIEKYPDYPEDRIDITIKDMQSYTYNLVTKDLGLSNLIESFVQKLEQAEEEKKKTEAALRDSFVTSAEDELKDAMTDEDYVEYNNFLEDEVQKDIENLLAIMDGGA